MRSAHRMTASTPRRQGSEASTGSSCTAAGVDKLRVTGCASLKPSTIFIPFRYEALMLQVDFLYIHSSIHWSKVYTDQSLPQNYTGQILGGTDLQKFLFHTFPSLTGWVQSWTTPFILFLSILLSPLTAQPTNTDFTVQSHLYFSWCCSAPLCRQKEQDTTGEDSFHFLDIAERRIRKLVSVITAWKDTSNTLLEGHRACSRDFCILSLRSSLMDVVIDFKRKTHGSRKEKKEAERWQELPQP